MSETYIARALRRMAEELPDCPPDLIRLYTLLAMTVGQGTLNSDVHNAWAIWTQERNPHHPSLVPYEDLTDEVKHLDRPYTIAIRMIAKEFDW